MHHPTVIAAYAEGRKWTFQGDVDLKSKFWGRSIELMPQGSLLLDFHDGDQYVWHKVRLGVQSCKLGIILHGSECAGGPPCRDIFAWHMIGFAVHGMACCRVL